MTASPSLGPLDAAFAQALHGPYLSALPAPKGRRWATLVVGFAPQTWTARLDGVDLDPATLPGWDALHQALRAHMPDLLWPVVLTMRIATFGEEWKRPESIGFSLFGHEVRVEQMGLNGACLRYSYRDLCLGFDAMAARFARLAAALPPTNQGPQMWCEGHDLMGCAHVSGDGVVARGPVEARAKMAWLVYGWKGPQPIEPDRPAARMARWLVSADLVDAYTDPFSTLVSSRGHDAEVAAAFAALAGAPAGQDGDPDGPRPTGNGAGKGAA